MATVQISDDMSIFMARAQIDFKAKVGAMHPSDARGFRECIKSGRWSDPRMSRWLGMLRTEGFAQDTSAAERWLHSIDDGETDDDNIHAFYASTWIDTVLQEV